MQAKRRAPLLRPAGLVLAGVAGCVAVTDQVSKAIASSALSSQDVWLIPGWLRLSLTRNAGGAFGFLPGGRVVFLGLTVAFLAVVVAGLGRLRSVSTGLGLGLLLGGAIGNAADRLLAPGGLVTDFIDFRWWPTFNVADIAIVTGSVMVAIAIWRRPIEPDTPGAGADPETPEP